MSLGSNEEIAPAQTEGPLRGELEPKSTTPDRDERLRKLPISCGLTTDAPTARRTGTGVLPKPSSTPSLSSESASRGSLLANRWARRRHRQGSSRDASKGLSCQTLPSSRTSGTPFTKAYKGCLSSIDERWADIVDWTTLALRARR